jgi:hypothetical protein
MRWVGITIGLGLAVMAFAQGGGKPRPEAQPLPAVVTAQADLSAVLGQPTATSITVNVLSAMAREGYLEYGTKGFDQRTAQTAFPAGTPVEITLQNLKADTVYSYRLCARKVGETAFTPGAAQTFHTQRAPGSAFTFCIQGDSHPERPHQHDPALYAQTLLAVAVEKPDFYLTIGDDFSVDTLRETNADTVKAVYLRQRACLSLLGVPLFLVNGNHEQAALCNLDGTANNVAVWTQTTRNRLFPQPAPDAFYTGDAQPVEHIGLLRDYYAWTWGDALFVVIAPYWHTKVPVDNVRGAREHGTRDLWQVTLGDTQYAWLKTTLEKSTAKYKFVFAHHVMGTGRGGTDMASLYEWGGKDRNGADLFAQKRPTWALPIHQLFVKTGVTIFFQGHDHIFAYQQLDGVTYQTLPDPANPNYVMANEQAYRTGTKLPGSGYVRITVAPDKATVAYIRQYLPKDETADRKSGEVAYSYTVPARTP